MQSYNKTGKDKESDRVEQRNGNEENKLKEKILSYPVAVVNGIIVCVCG